MGQKTSPKGFRLAVKRDWRSVWFAPSKLDFGRTLIEDFRIREFLWKKPYTTGASDILIKRMGEKIEVTICTSRPGMVIGKKGSGVEGLRKELSSFVNKDVWVEISEIKRPDTDARLIADSVSRQLRKRSVPYRRVLKKAIQTSMDAGVKGVKIAVSGRLGGAEIARCEWYKEGQVPLHHLRANIGYASVRAETSYGSIGVKVWVHLQNFGLENPSKVRQYGFSS